MMLEKENKMKFNFQGMMSWILDNLVTIIFIMFVVFGFSVSKDLPITFFLSELCDRIFRNSFLVLSLIIPVLAGLGLNFGIVIGAMSGQAAIAIARYFNIGGIGGFMLCFVLAFFFAALCGYFTGKLYNKTRGQEMIASLIVGFFANGVYQFIFLFVVGAIIAVPATHPMIKPDGIGIRMTVDLVPVEEGGLKFVLENVYKISFVHALLIISAAILVMLIVIYCWNKMRGMGYKNRPMSFGFNALICLLVAGIAVYTMSTTPKLSAAASDLNAIANRLYAAQSNTAPPDLKAIETDINAVADRLNSLAAEYNADVTQKLNVAAASLNKTAAMAAKASASSFSAVASILSSVESDINGIEREVLAAAKANMSPLEANLNDFSSSLRKVRSTPVVTGIFIIALCIFTSLIMKTKLGQDFRSVGQSQHIAEVSGINVDRTRIIATMISTVLASWGQLIYLQSMGTLNTYGAHTQIGMFSVAALLVGGASTSKASIKNAIFGTILFNAMFIISPDIGQALFGNALLGEYFRTFLAYGVIGVALGLYVWKGNKKDKLAVE